MFPRFLPFCRELNDPGFGNVVPRDYQKLDATKIGGRPAVFRRAPFGMYQPAYKPGSGWHAGKRPAHVTAIPLGRRLPGASSNQPGRQDLDTDPEAASACAQAAPRRPYSVLLPVGFAVPPTLPPARCALTAPFHPCCAPSQSRMGSSGLFSVALSLGSRPPDVIRHRRSMEPGLSSPVKKPERPSVRLTTEGWGRRVAPSRGEAFERLGAGRHVARPAAAGEQVLQGLARRSVGDAVDPLLPKMALKRGDHVVRHGIIVTVGADAVAVIVQRFLQRRDPVAAIAERQQRLVVAERGRIDPMADAGIVQRAPRKFFARVLLAPRRHVGMRQ